MGLGLYLRAVVRSADPLGVVERYLRTHAAEVLEGVSTGDGNLSAGLHPAAEDVDFIVEEEQLTVSAKTSTVGPGYHAYLCDLLHGLAGELGTSFHAVSDEDGEDGGDETGYFTSGDRLALEDEMLRWLAGLANTIAEQAAEGSTGFMVSMSADAVFEGDGAILTPLGPRSAAWLAATGHEPRAGIDIFPWWPSGLCAEHAAGRALARMWTEVRWREPVDDDELQLLEKVDQDLRRAHALAPALALPWAEWAAIQAWLGRDDALARQVEGRARSSSASIGYRRRPVRVTLTGGWSVKIPGAMTSGFDDEGTWCGFMPGLTVWMSSFTIGDPEKPTRSAAETLPKTEPGDSVVELAPVPGDYARRASLGTTDEGDTKLTVEVALPHRLALFTFVLDDEDDLDGALKIAAEIRG